MPYPSKRRARYNAQKKDAKGRFMKENVPVIVSEEVTEINEDRETLGGKMDISALSCLRDSVSSGRKRKTHYTGDSRTTKWRRKVECSKVDPKSTLFNFGITIVNNDSQEQEEENTGHKLNYPQRELNNIGGCIDLLQPEMI